MRETLREMYGYLRLPPAARAEYRRDRAGPGEDPGIERAMEASIAWLCRAQDWSASHDGGVARHFSLLAGWSTSYPETTGYIVPTMLACARIRSDKALRDRARRMLDWLVSIQLPGGGFQGGTIDSAPVVPVVFNTGQILLGLAAGAREFGDERYAEAMRGAADWLVATQDQEGSWREASSPFAGPGAKAYDTHVAWGLLEAARLEPGAKYAEAALANVRWALGRQRDNGWLDECCLTDFSQPLTHTLGYALRGLIEAYRFTGDRRLLEAAVRTADGLLDALGEDGFLPGRLDANWRGTVPWACLTGTAQVATCWLMLYQDGGDVRHRDAGCAANRYVRRTTRVAGPPDTRGAIKGSFPVDGDYGAYQYLNWACKFAIDSNMLESAVTGTLGTEHGLEGTSPDASRAVARDGGPRGGGRVARVQCLSAVEPQEWDEQVQRLGGGFHHSYAYARYEASRSRVEPLFVRAFDHSGECVGLTVGTIASPRWWPLTRLARVARLGALPATLDRSGATEIATMVALEDELRRRGVCEIHVSAYDSRNSARVLGQLGYRLIERYEFYLDLGQPLDRMWAGLKSARRRNIRKAEGLGVTTTSDGGLSGLRLLDAFQADSMHRRGVTYQAMDPAAESAKLELLEAGRAMLLVSACAGTPMNAAMFGVFGGKAYYLYSGSSLEGNARCGPVHLIWTGLQRLKEQGITCVNLGGALPGGGTDGRERELYRFKKDFGTAIVRQPAGVKTIGRLGVSLQAFASRLRRSGH